MYSTIRICVLGMLVCPIILYTRDKINTGDLCLLVAAALIFIQLADINSKLENKDIQSDNNK